MVFSTVFAPTGQFEVAALMRSTDLFASRLWLVALNMVKVRVVQVNVFLYSLHALRWLFLPPMHSAHERFGSLCMVLIMSARSNRRARTVFMYELCLLLP